MAKFNDQIKQKLLAEFYEKGTVVLANELNVNYKTIYYWRKKLGLKPKRKNRTKRIEMSCYFCEKTIYRTQNYIENAKKKNVTNFTCSKQCAASKKESKSLSLKILEMAINGKKNKEISQILNVPMGTVASCLNRKKYRRYGENGQSYGVTKTQLRREYKECQICGFDRIIEIAHILPAAKGGQLSKENTVPLCPNHHHLFDHNRLLKEEFEKIKDKVLKIRSDYGPI